MRGTSNLDQRTNFEFASKDAPRPSCGSKTDRGETRMSRLLVSTSICIDPDLLQAINDNVKGKNQSERIRLCIQEGYGLKAK